MSLLGGSFPLRLAARERPESVEFDVRSVAAPSGSGAPHWFSKIDGSITYVETRFAIGK